MIISIIFDISEIFLEKLVSEIISSLFIVREAGQSARSANHELQTVEDIQVEVSVQS